MNRLTTATSITAILATGTTTLADPIYTFSGGIYGTTADYTYGFQFTPTTNITVDSLGFFDYNADGLVAGHQVGIWSGSGVLLASTTVTTSDSQLAGPTVANGRFRYAPIAGLSLAANTPYVFGAASDGNDDGWNYGVTNLSAAPALATVGPTGVYSTAPFAFPQSSIGNTYAIGSFTATAAVPEPTSVAALCTVTAAAAAAGGRGRHRFGRRPFTTAGTRSRLP